MSEQTTGTQPETRASVIITFYNQASWVKSALDSVSSQTENRVRLIITDDGSRDDTREEVIRWIDAHDVDASFVTSEENVGLPAMLNRAIPHLHGPYVIILNGDDWMEPDRVSRQADALDSMPSDVGVVYSDIREVNAEGVSTGKVFPTDDTPKLHGHVLLSLISEPSLIGMPQIMFRRSILDEIGIWDESLMADDFDFVLRTADAGFKFVYLPGVVLNLRRYAGSMTNSTNQGHLPAGRIDALLKLMGSNRQIEDAVLARVGEIAITLHGLGYDAEITRRHLRYVAKRRPSKRIVRASLEAHLGIRPGRLSPKYWISRNSMDNEKWSPGATGAG